MKVLVSERLSEHKYKTPEGYLICTDAILARTGKQTYTKDEVFGDGDNSEIDIDRPYDQVMNEKTIASFENKPVTFDHPDEDVNVGNYKDYAIGYVRDVHQGKTDKGEDVIIGNLVITDQDAIDAIEQGDHTDLSCGYDCDIKDDNRGGYMQTNIRGNHVALCKEGRAGNARIIDSKLKYDSLDDSDSSVGIIFNKLYNSDYDSFDEIKRDFDRLKSSFSDTEKEKIYKAIALASGMTISSIRQKLGDSVTKSNFVDSKVNDSKQMTVTDALKILNIVKSVKARDEYLGMVYINGRPMYVIHKKEPGIPEFWGITPSKWGDNPRKKFKSKKELDDYLTSVNAVSN